MSIITYQTTYECQNRHNILPEEISSISIYIDAIVVLLQLATEFSLSGVSDNDHIVFIF